MRLDVPGGELSYCPSRASSQPFPCPPTASQMLKSTTLACQALKSHANLTRRLQSTLPSSIQASLASAGSTSETEAVTLHGWIRACRKQKNVAFAVLNDGSSLNGVQVVLKKGLEEG